MVKVLYTDSKNKDFQKLVELLDNELAKIDGEEHAFYHQFNAIDHLNHVVVFYQNNTAVSCGAIKALDHETVEVKRMYTLQEYRGKGIATQVLLALEKWAKKLNYLKCRLETGVRQPDAIRLYQKNGYQIIENYGQYMGVENSKCFEKTLTK